MGRNNFRGGGQNRHRERKVFPQRETAATYFVPSFSVRRHVSRQSEKELRDIQDEVRRRLGRDYTIVDPTALTLKVMNQREFIRRMREADIHPKPEDMRDLAFGIRDGLTRLLEDAPSTLRVPLGELSIFGYNNHALALTLEGWGGYKARYAARDENNVMTAHGAIVAEADFCVGMVNEAMGGDGLVTDNLINTPHMTLARYTRDIHEGTLRDVRAELADILPDEVEMGDPVIELRMTRADATDVLYVRHAWDSLAVF